MCLDMYQNISPIDTMVRNVSNHKSHTNKVFLQKARGIRAAVPKKV